MLAQNSCPSQKMDLPIYQLAPQARMELEVPKVADNLKEVWLDILNFFVGLEVAF